MVHAQNDVSEAQRLAEEMGQRLFYVREYRQWTATEMAARVGVEEAMIRHIEKGRRGPSVPLIATLCYVLGITPQYLFYGDVKGIDPELEGALPEKHPELKWPKRPQSAGKWNKARKSSLQRTREKKPRPSAALG